MKSRLAPFKSQKRFLGLQPEVRKLIEEKAEQYLLSFQDLRQLIEASADFEMWGEGSLLNHWKDEPALGKHGKDRKKAVLNVVFKRWQNLKNSLPDYSGFSPEDFASPNIHHQIKQKGETILGDCPVASPKTRCCNLQTLDAVINCGFDCSYCSIQSFYDQGNIYFQPNLARQLKEVNLNPDQIYHIGTGQSSDSLLWGNENGVLEDLFSFAEANPNVILELKSKSARIDFLQNRPIPANVIVTWSLSTPVIIQNEEQGSASLERRLEAARIVSDLGALVGFHFHPMVLYKGWKEDYGQVFKQVKEMFKPEELALISFGTLTFIKSVLQKLRERKRKSKILQMPLVEAAGKFSYPRELKEELFSFAYDSFSDWDKRVFLYLCMEDPILWKKCFGRDYIDNDDFEKDMKKSYMTKIEKVKTERGLL